MDDSDPDYHRLYAQYVINQLKPITVIKTNKDYEKIVINLGGRIRNNIDNPPERKFTEQVESAEQWEPWSEDRVASIQNEMDRGIFSEDDTLFYYECIEDDHLLFSEYIIQRCLRTTGKIKTKNDYKKAVSELMTAIQARIDDLPESPIYCQSYRAILTYYELLAVQGKGVTQIKGCTSYNGCETCKSEISNKVFLVDDLINSYQRPAISKLQPILIPHLGCTTNCYDESEGCGYCRCSWTEILSRPPDVDPEFADWLDKLIEEDRKKHQ